MEYSSVGMKVSHIKKLCGETKVQLLTGDGTVLGVYEPDDIPSFLLERYVDGITPDFTGEGDGEWVLKVELVCDTVQSVMSSALEEEFDRLRKAYLDNAMFDYEIAESVAHLLTEIRQTLN